MVWLNRSRGGNWQRLRYQLPGCIVIAAVLPYALRILTLPASDITTLLHQTFVGSLAAIILGTWLFRNISTYPGVEESTYILPSFSLSYAIILMILLLGRLEYNRTLLISGYILSVLWFYFVYFRIQRQRRLRIGIIPFGAVDALREIERIDWTRLSGADHDVSGLDAIATDLRIDLPDGWDRRLADYALAGLPVYHFKHLLESLTGRVELELLSENSFGSLAPASAYMSVKHAIDWVIAAIVLILLAPFMLLAAIIIRCESPGPAIFRQPRVGYQGKIFTVYKFRTMYITEESSDARESAMTKDGDSRVTRFGRFLRRTRIDELPQIINILKNEMSWIGPRPEAEVLSRWYEADIRFYRYRHIVRPGITGWAQVSQGHVADVSEVRSKLHYDFYYIKNFSPWIDMLIVARTIRTVVTGFGSR